MADEKTNLPATAPAPRQYHMVQAPEAVFDTANFEHMARVAGMMARSTLLPAHLRVMRYENGQQLEPGQRPGNNVAVFVDQEATAANAFLIVNQARLFGGVDPFALAQVSYFVHGRLGFEGKLVQAVLERAIGAMEFEYSGEPGTPGYGITVTAWVPNADPRRKASLKGTVAEWQTTKQDGSVLQQWRGPAGQTRMLHYRGTREWARMYAPGLALGLLDDDDLEAMRDDLRARSARQIPGPGFNPLRDEDETSGAGPQRIPAAVLGGARPAPAPTAQDISHRAEKVNATITHGPATTTVQDPPYDPATGEVQAEAPAAAGGAAQAEEPPISTEERDVGHQRLDPPASSTKRLPRGFGKKVDIAIMETLRAVDRTDLDARWDTWCKPLVDQIRADGLPTPSVDRMMDAFQKRAANFEVMAKANMPAETEKAAPVQTPAATDATTASQAEAPAPAEAGEDWQVFLSHVRDELAAAQSFENVDDVVDTTIQTRDLPQDIAHQVDDLVEARRKAIGDANAAEVDSQVTADRAAEQAHASDFPGEADIAPTAGQLQDIVDGWVKDMRAIKSTAELARYNDDVITPYVKGKWGHLIPKDALDDAEHTYRTRYKLLGAR